MHSRSVAGRHCNAAWAWHPAAWSCCRRTGLVLKASQPPISWTTNHAMNWGAADGGADEESAAALWNEGRLRSAGRRQV
jgi:hypothetical protein